MADAASSAAAPDVEKVAASSTEPSSEASKEPEPDMDALFGELMGEVNSLKRDKQKKVELKFNGTPEELIQRLIDGVYSTPFEALGVNPDVTDNELTKTYRKMSFLIHPDKCKHEKAHDAFQLLAKAYNDCKDPSQKEKYKEVIEQARARVEKRVAKENKKRAKKGEDLLAEEGKDFEQDVMKECDKILKGDVEVSEYAIKTREANEKRLREGAKKNKVAAKQENKQQKEWDKNRNKRVAGWQTFLGNVSSKKFKDGSMAHIGQVGQKLKS